MRHRLSLGRWGPRRTRHHSRGQSLVELALILPIMFLLFASALDLGRVFYSQITIENAAKEGALEAALHPDSFSSTEPCDAETNRVLCLVLNEARGSMYTIGPGDVSLSCSPSPCPTTPVLGNTVTVSVVGHFTLATPILAPFTGGQQITLHASATSQLGVVPKLGMVAAPTPSPTPSPTPVPTAEPSAEPSAEPTPTTEPTATPEPICETPDTNGSISANPGSGKAGATTGTLFTFSAPNVVEQPGCTFVYTWTFGDGAGGDGEVITHRYATEGTGKNKTYTVKLVISTVGADVPWSDTRSVVVNP